MRIISGRFRGRHIQPPRNISARPTTDFAKEALFNLLANRIDFEGLKVLDLFAGTGGISFEFVSRGASEVTSVEIANVQQNFIIRTSKELNITNLHVVRGDVFRFVKNTEEKFDFIYADPPYALPNLPTIPDVVFCHDLLKSKGLLVLEHSAANDFSEHPHFLEHRTYGSVNFSFFQ